MFFVFSYYCTVHIIFLLHTTEALLNVKLRLLIFSVLRDLCLGRSQSSRINLAWVAVWGLPEHLNVIDPMDEELKSETWASSWILYICMWQLMGNLAEN